MESKNELESFLSGMSKTESKSLWSDDEIKKMISDLGFHLKEDKDILFTEEDYDKEESN